MGQNFGFVKVAAAIPRVEIADCIYNEREIYNQIIEAVHLHLWRFIRPYAFIGTGSKGFVSVGGGD